jgi:pilus assembly protein Flp/PilA
LSTEFDVYVTHRTVLREHLTMRSQNDVCKEPIGMNTVARFMDDESGATAIEYGLIAALIAVGIIAAATVLGGSLSNLFNRISDELAPTAAAPPPAPPAGP